MLIFFYLFCFPRRTTFETQQIISQNEYAELLSVWQWNKLDGGQTNFDMKASNNKLIAWRELRATSSASRDSRG